MEEQEKEKKKKKIKLCKKQKQNYELIYFSKKICRRKSERIRIQEIKHVENKIKPIFLQHNRKQKPSIQTRSIGLLINYPQGEACYSKIRELEGPDQLTIGITNSHSN